MSLPSQSTTDAIGRAAAEAMQGPIQAAYKDAFQSIVLPVFERGCQSMFQQINESFKQGTQECKSGQDHAYLHKTLAMFRCLKFLQSRNVKVNV